MGEDVMSRPMPGPDGRCPRCFAHISNTGCICYECGYGKQWIIINGEWYHPDDVPEEYKGLGQPQLPNPYISTTGLLWYSPQSTTID
jgi:hypothetical protein